MVRMRSPVRIWPAAPESAWSHAGLGAFSSYRIAFRTGDLTGEACFNKTRRPPEAVAASSNLASSSRKRLVPCGTGRFFKLQDSFSNWRPRRSKRYVACSDFLCLWQKNQSVLIPLLLLSKSKHQWSASIWTIVGKQAAYRLLLIVYRAGTLKAGAFAPA